MGFNIVSYGKIALTLFNHKCFFNITFRVKAYKLLFVVKVPRNYTLKQT